MDVAVEGIESPSKIAITDDVAPYVRRTVYDGRATRIGSILFGNTLLNIVTLGIYRFWGRTRLRRYLWGACRLWDEPLRYTGTGMELFVGFLIALLFLVPLGLLLGFMGMLTAGWSILASSLLEISAYSALMFLFGIAIYRARRYQLSRTVWREIRAGQTGSSVAYSLRWLSYAMLSLVTLGLASPVQTMKLQHFVTPNTWFGDRAFAFDGRARDVMGRWVLCWLLALPTLTLSLLWYAAYEWRYMAEHTRFDGLRFRLPVRFGDVLGIYLPYLIVFFALLAAVWLILSAEILFLVQVALIVLSGGALDPAAASELGPAALKLLVAYIVVFALILPPLAVMMVTHRLFGLFLGRLAIQGEPDFAAIAQSDHSAPGSGEGLADTLGLGGI